MVRVYLKLLLLFREVHGWSVVWGVVLEVQRQQWVFFCFSQGVIWRSCCCQGCGTESAEGKVGGSERGSPQPLGGLSEATDRAATGKSTAVAVQWPCVLYPENSLERF